jgi:hypothetical protein
MSHSMFKQITTVVVLGLFLTSACALYTPSNDPGVAVHENATSNTVPATTVDQSVQSAAKSADKSADIEPQQVIEPLIEPEVAPESETPEVIVIPEPPIIVPSQQSLMGTGPDSLTRIFGEPSFVRRDPPAQLWQYKTTACIMDLYLYENTSQLYALSHLEIRTTNFAYDNYEDCARQILRNLKG